MTREQNIAELLWNHGGDGWGICAVGNFLAAVSGPQRHIKSPVLVGIRYRNEIAGFTDVELADLVKLSQAVATYKKLREYTGVR